MNVFIFVEYSGVLLCTFRYALIELLLTYFIFFVHFCILIFICLHCDNTMYVYTDRCVVIRADDVRRRGYCDHFIATCVYAGK